MPEPFRASGLRWSAPGSDPMDRCPAAFRVVLLVAILAAAASPAALAQSPGYSSPTGTPSAQPSPAPEEPAGSATNTSASNTSTSAGNSSTSASNTSQESPPADAPANDGSAPPADAPSTTQSGPVPQEEGGRQPDAAAGEATPDAEAPVASPPRGQPPAGSDDPSERQPPSSDAPRDGSDMPEGMPRDALPTFRDTQDGFETIPPAQTQRPSVQVDAREGVVTIERAGVEPLTTRLASLVEYEDEDGDGAYDLGERMVRSYDLRAHDPFVLVGDGNATRDVVHDLDQGARLILRFAVGGDNESVGAKFDVRIEGLSFASPTTRVAVGMLVRSSAPLLATEVDGAPAVVATSGSEGAYLSWITRVAVDGADHPVGWSVHTSLSDASAIVHWSYPQGASIVHDPALGIAEIVRELPGQAGPFAIGVVISVLVLGAGLMVRARRARA